jgi:hypothetical protein
VLAEAELEVAKQEGAGEQSEGADPFAHAPETLLGGRCGRGWVRGVKRLEPLKVRLGPEARAKAEHRDQQERDCNRNPEGWVAPRANRLPLHASRIGGSLSSIEWGPCCLVSTRSFDFGSNLAWSGFRNPSGKTPMRQHAAYGYGSSLTLHQRRPLSCGRAEACHDSCRAEADRLAKARGSQLQWQVRRRAHETLDDGALSRE